MDLGFPLTANFAYSLEFLIFTHVSFFQPIVNINFAGKSDYLLSVSHGSKPRLAVCSMSKLVESWSYRLQVEGINFVYFSLNHLFIYISGIVK